MGLGVGKVGNPQGLHYGACDVIRTENSPEPPPFSNGDSGECPSNGSGIGKNRLLNLVAVNGAGQVVEVVPRSHRHAVGSGRLDRKQVAAAGLAQGDVLVEHVGRFAGRAHDGIFVARLVFGGDVLDVVVRAVEAAI